MLSFVIIIAIALIVIGLRIWATRLYTRREERRVRIWPFVSVIIPAYNEEAYIRDTIKSIKAQDYPGTIEIIVGLNGCSDNTEEIAKSEGVHVAKTDSKGISVGRNVGAKIARGQILIFSDADTTLPSDCIRKLVMPLQDTSRGIAVLGGRPDKGGLVVRAVFVFANFYARRKKASPPGPVMAVHRTVFDAVNGFDESLPQGTSTDFIWRVQKAGARYIYVPGITVATSVRRFEKHGIFWQMLSWRKNHKLLQGKRRDEVEKREYVDIR